MEIKIETNRGHEYIVTDPEYDATAVEAELNDTESRKMFIAFGDVVLQRSSIISVAPVNQETESTTG